MNNFVDHFIQTDQLEGKEPSNQGEKGENRCKCKHAVVLKNDLLIAYTCVTKYTTLLYVKCFYVQLTPSSNKINYCNF